MWTLSYSPSKLEKGSNLITSLKRCERVYSPILPLPRRSKRMKQELLGRVKEKRTPEPPGNACGQSSTSAWCDLPTRHRGAMKVERAGAGLRLQRSVSGAEQAPGTSCPAPPPRTPSLRCTRRVGRKAASAGVSFAPRVRSEYEEDGLLPTCSSPTLSSSARIPSGDTGRSCKK